MKTSWASLVMKFDFYLMWLTLLLSFCHRGQPTLLHNKFKHFQILKASNFVSRAKRDTTSNRLISETVTFSAFQRDFVLVLTPGSPILRPDFQVHLVNQDDELTPIEFDTEDVFTGHLQNVPSSRVNAVFMDGLWLAQINTPEDMYSVEPLRYHESLASTSAAIIFRLRDVRDENITRSMHSDEMNNVLCGASDFDKDIKSLKSMDKSNQSVQGTLRYERDTFKNRQTSRGDRYGVSAFGNKFLESINGQRKESTKDGRIYSEQINPKIGKRVLTDSNETSKHKAQHTAPRHLVCDVLAVADYLTYSMWGESSPQRVVKLLVSVYLRVNLLLNEQVRLENTTFGIYLQGVFIHTNYTVSAVPHYNMKDTEMTPTQLLRSMAGVSSFTEYCLVHLTTQRSFKFALGTAAIAVPGEEWLSGICSSRDEKTTNIGLSTPQSSEGFMLSLATYSLVVTHEIAHNWGSPHDPEIDPVCSPRTADGGKYIMWPVAGLSADINSPKFSPCSLRAMHQVLRARTSKCFQNVDSLVGRCGDGVVDPDEDCDVMRNDQENDRCCTRQCRFRKNATCSPFNHPCCGPDCSAAPPTQKCISENDIPCYGASFCSGKDATTCPKPQSLPNNSSCGDGGKCWFGQCLSYCVLLGLSWRPPRQFKSCTCDDGPFFLCYHCCREVGTRLCFATSYPRRNGTPCLTGHCVDSVCTKLANRHEASISVSPTGRDMLDTATLVWNRLLTALTLVGVLWIILAAFVTSRKDPREGSRCDLDHTNRVSRLF